MHVTDRWLHRFLFFNPSCYKHWHDVSWQRQCADAKLVRWMII